MFSSFSSPSSNGEKKHKALLPPISGEVGNTSKGALDSSLSFTSSHGDKNDRGEGDRRDQRPSFALKSFSSPLKDNRRITGEATSQNPENQVSFSLLANSLAGKSSSGLLYFTKKCESRDDHSIEDNSGVASIPSATVGSGGQVPTTALQAELNGLHFTSASEVSQANNSVSQPRSCTFTKELQEEFRRMQVSRRDQFVKDLVLGKGFGEAAESTLKDAYYVPTKVMGVISEKDKKILGDTHFSTFSSRKKRRGRLMLGASVSFGRMDECAGRAGPSRSTSTAIKPLSGRGSVVFSVGLEEDDEKKGNNEERLDTSSSIMRNSLSLLPEGDFSGGSTSLRTDGSSRGRAEAARTAFLSSPQAGRNTEGSTRDTPNTLFSARRGSVSCPPFRTKEDFAVLDEEDEQNSFWEENQQESLMEKFRCTYKPITAISETRMEINENIRVAEKELERACAPSTLEEVIKTLSKALEAVERGYLSERVTLPMLVREKLSTDPRERSQQLQRERKDPLYLEGAQAVVDFVRDHVLPVAYKVVGVAHSVQWLLQYTMAFLQSISAQNEEEAHTRVQLLSQCMRIIGCTENLTALALSLVSKGEEYDSFAELKSSAEDYIKNTVEDVEKTLESILGFSFPNRRQELQKVDQTIQTKIRHALVLLNEIDTTWVPVVYYQMKWKRDFLSSVLKRIHCRITGLYMEASMGFVDTCLYELMKDSRVTQKMMNGAMLTMRVPRASQVEYDRVSNKMKFEIIALTLKGIGSRQIGLQLCMGSRYVLQQCGADFDEAWGFSMHEPSKESIAQEEKRVIEDMYEKVRRFSEKRRSRTYSSMSEVLVMDEEDEQ